MRYKILLRNGGSRIFNSCDELLEVLIEAKFSTALDYNRASDRERLVIKLWRDGELMGVALALSDSYQVNEKTTNWRVRNG